MDYVTAEALKSSLEMTGMSFADDDIAIAITAASRGLERAYSTLWHPPANDPSERFYRAGERTVELGDVLRIDSVALDYWGGTYAYTLPPEQYRALPIFNGLTLAGGNGEPFEYLELLRGAFVGWDIYRDPRRTLPSGDFGIRVTGLFGWETVPAAVKQATTIIAARFLRRAREAPFGILAIGAEGRTLKAASIADDPDIRFVMEGAAPSGSLVF